MCVRLGVLMYILMIIDLSSIPTYLFGNIKTGVLPTQRGLPNM